VKPHYEKGKPSRQRHHQGHACDHGQCGIARGRRRRSGGTAVAARASGGANGGGCRERAGAQRAADAIAAAAAAGQQRARARGVSRPGGGRQFWAGDDEKGLGLQKFW
jgi:hypothetical protein